MRNRLAETLCWASRTLRNGPQVQLSGPSGCLSFWGGTVDAFWRMDDMDDGEHGILGSVLFVFICYVHLFSNHLLSVDLEEILHHLRCIIMG